MKIVVLLPVDAPSSAETMWAYPSNDANQLANIPIWAYGLGYEDLVKAKLGADGRLYVTEVVNRSGLLTVRIAVTCGDAAQLRALLHRTRDRAVASEQYSETYWAYALTDDVFKELEPSLDDASAFIEFEVANDEAFEILSDEVIASASTG